MTEGLVILIILNVMLLYQVFRLAQEQSKFRREVLEKLKGSP